MSWLGGLNDSFNQLSSLTGQIGGQLSNFTKEVLTETSEENIDYEVEVKRLTELLKENESLVADLKQGNLILEERARKADLLLSTSETEWRNKLERQNEELTQLRHRVDNRVGLQNADDVGNHAFQSSFTTVSLDHDEDEFHDIIAKQREIEYLSAELENAHKKISNLEEKEKVAASVSGDVQRQNADLTLQQRIQELEDGIRREAEHHRKEMQTMEDCNKAAILRYQEEIKKLKQISSGDNNVEPTKSEQEYVKNMRIEAQHLQSELDDLKNQMRTRNRQLQAQKKQIDEMKTVAEERKLELDNFKHRENEFITSKKEWENERNNLKSEIQAMNQQMIVIRKGISTLVACNDAGVELDGENIASCLEQCVVQYRHLVEEKAALSATNIDLETQIGTLKGALQQAQEQATHAETAPSEKGSNESMKECESPVAKDGTPLGHSSPQVSSAKRALLPQHDDSMFHEPGDLTLTKQALQKQIEDYEKEIAEYERVQSEWHIEKKALQTLLNRYQNEMGEVSPREQADEAVDERASALAKLKEEMAELQAVRGDLEKDFNRIVLEKDQFQSAAKKLEAELNVSMSDAKLEKDSLRRELNDFTKEKEKLQAAYDILTQELNESRMENDALDEALEALDSQHQAEMNQLLTVRDDVKEELKKVKNQLEVEKLAQSNLEKKLVIAEQNSRIKCQQFNEKIVDKNKEIKDLKNDIDAMQTKIHELEQSRKEGTKSLNSLQSEKAILTEKIATLEELVRKTTVEKEHLLQSSTENSHVKNQGGVDQHLSVSGDNEVDDKMQCIKDLEEDLNGKDATIETLVMEKKEADIKSSAEISQLQNEIENLGKELEESGKEFMKLQLEHEAKIISLRTECDDKLTKTINEMHQSFEKEKNAIKTETDATNKVYQQKTVHFETLHSDLAREMESVKSQYLETVKEKDILIENLKSQYDQLSKSNQNLQNSFETMKNSIENEKSSYSNKLKSQDDEKNVLHAECMNLKSMLEKAKSSELTLTKEVSSLNLQIKKCNQEIHELKENRRFLTQKQNEQTAKIAELLVETERLKTESTSSSNVQLSDESEELLSRLGSSDVVGVEKSDLSKDDVGSLLKLIKERDSTIETLKRSAVTNVHMSPEHEKLKNDYRTLSAEKDQILSVISEKTKENRKLKDDIHKMHGVVAESKAALEKVQNENNTLVKKYEGYDDEMTKEGISKLSRLVMEKDLEIESLRQKCGTLLEVLQQQPGGGSESAANMVSGEQVQTLLKEKEILTSQVRQLLNERNQLVTLLNQSQIEMNTAKMEASKAAEALEKDSDNNSKLQIGYSNLVHDYDQVQLKMTSMQREFGVLQDKFADLERIKNYLLGKLEELGVSDVGMTVESMQKKSNTSEDTTKSSANEAPHHDLAILHSDIREKDLLIHSRTEELKRLSKDLSAKSNEVVILRRSVENLREQVGALTKSCNEAQVEVREVTSKLDEKEAESRAFQETNAQLSVLLKEKEYELESLAEKCGRLDALMKEQQQGTQSEAQKYLQELDISKQALIHTRHERDQVMLSLKQKKREADKFAEEARNALNKEGKSKSEIERLTNHLIQVEETYTQEAVLAEDRIASLQEQLEKAQSRQNAVREAGEQYQQQVEGLQEQLRTVIAQRDHTIHQLQLSQKQSIQYATTIQNLQIAVERMQREEAASFAEKIANLNSQLEAMTIDANIYKSLSDELQMKLDNATDALKSASRLNAQLEMKEESINQLKGIVAEKQLENDDLQSNLHILSSKAEAMVDKDILKNLFLGYFTTPANQRQEVLRLISGVLGLSDEEMRKLTSGGSDKGARAWIGGWLWRGGGAMQNRQSVSVPVTPRSGNPNQSFTQMFVKFLETESVPHQAPRLPAAAMVSEAQQKRRPLLHSVPTPISPTRSGPVVAGRYSPYLLSSTPKGRDPVTSNPVAITPMLPNFEPIINAKPAGEQEILQDILLNRGDG